MNVGAAYTFMWAGDMSVDQGDALSVRGRVAGSYENAWFSIASRNLTWHF